MTTEPQHPVGSLSGRHPQPGRDRLLADLVPPRHFADASFDSYRPDPAFASQADAVALVRDVATRIAAPQRRSLWRRGAAPSTIAIYLDGGFGVGKTHLLAALAHAVPGTAYGTFVEFTNLVGALGFAATVDALAQRPLVCIDEFELDDPGDTVLMSRLMRELGDRGVALAATSNTLPDSLGEGRFAAEDFRREIQALAARFAVLRVDGEDYRRRSSSASLAVVDDADVLAAVHATPGATVDDFDTLCSHLAQLHPSRFGALVDGIDLVGLTGVHHISRQDIGLRLVVLIDRLYDRDVPVVLGSHDLPSLFSLEMMRGGYRKKYARALSRLGVLASAGAERVTAAQE